MYIDWYSTFCHLAGGLDPTDKRAAKHGLPPVESINMWPFLMGKNGFDVSERKDVFLSSGNGGGLIMENNVSKYKILFGNQDPAFWTTLDFPNGTIPELQSIDCGGVKNGGCFFDIMNDPTEHDDLINKSEYKQLIEEIRKKYIEMNNTTFSPNRGEPDNRCCDQIIINKGYWGPWLNATRD